MLKQKISRINAGQLKRQTQSGFSLIEFLVASIISMIVLIAAGSTYFTTQQLNRVATERLNAQQDLRNAANLIVRDARQAGTFGCANLADPAHSPEDLIILSFSNIHTHIDIHTYTHTHCHT